MAKNLADYVMQKYPNLTDQIQPRYNTFAIEMESLKYLYSKIKSCNRI